jgi:hypothetical protein
MLLLLIPGGPIPSIVTPPGLGVVARPVDPSGATVQRPGDGDLVQRPDAATGAMPSWVR